MNGSAALYRGTFAAPGTVDSIVPIGQPQPYLNYERTILSIDSIDRNSNLYTSANQYSLRLKTPFKNIIEIRLLSIEIPASFYIFSESAGNTKIFIKESVWVDFRPIVLPDGNYTLPELCDTLTGILQTVTERATYVVSLNLNTLKITISNSDGVAFQLDTNTGSLPQPVFWGLGYCLGFNKGIYATSTGTMTAPRIANINPYNYMILDLGDLNMVQEGEIMKGYFAKIPINVQNFNYIYLTPECCDYNVARFEPPLGKLEKINIKWRFHDGRLIDFNGFEHSFMLEVITGEARLKHPQINRI
jgi:hypothetical protein